MLKFLVNSSRLIVIYILTVLISGGILTWLSFNSISNFKELTEKRISEEQKIIIENYSSEFHSILEYLSKQLESQIRKDSLPYRNTTLSNEELTIENSLIMNSNGALIKPRFVHESDHSSQINPSRALLSIFNNAGQLEFMSKNYSEAEKQYRLALKHARQYSDTARIYNAMARLFIKLEKPDDAVGMYSKIISEYSDARNELGFPYSYFAVTQLIGLRKNNSNDIGAIILSFLKTLKDDRIPWNDYTGNIIEEIINFPVSNENRKQEINSLCYTIKGIINDVEHFEKQMQSAIQNQNNQTPAINGFFLVLPENERNRIMLMKENSSVYSGFIFELSSIHSTIKNNMHIVGNKFHYSVNLIDAELGNLSFQDELTEQSNFTPYFNHKMIKVALEDPEVVDDYIFRRKLLTVIGLVLLLGAMMIGMYTLIRDIKRRRMMEKLRSDFVSNVTHELKTPLTSINMFADSILIGTVKTEENIKKYAKVIVKESDRLKRMINNILDFSRKENDKLNYNIRPCELSVTIGEILEEMNYWLEINHFEVSLELNKNVKANADPEGLKQVISNLISNVIKYSSKTRRLIIRAFENGESAFIEVEDFGDGIPKDKQDKIFEKFYRIQSKDNETISGTGLGLTVSKDIIEAMGGKILVQSEPGKGSKFIVELRK